MKTAEQEEKQKAFLQRAKANLKNNDLHQSLIAKHIEPLYQQPFRGSIQSFEESGHVSGSLLLALMNYAEAYANQSRWISVEERLPEELASVLLCTDKSYVTQGYITGLKTKDGKQIWHETYVGNQYHNVIFWQPLPPAPNEAQPREEEVKE